MTWRYDCRGGYPDGLLTNFLLAHWLLLLAGALALPIIGLGVYILHTRIEAKIAGLEEL
uniref:Uncharacterized protein n=1 Tax=Candidatus Kentrum sp. LPFa TaxID=2126335 RepID=A0A450WUF8_9GAMM|nr:MAG: hypothetical protein BECKLPF1236B_GA0070989_12224 [Candidatus Kentron sp. LPFa]